jgi:hypothetical protein
LKFDAACGSFRAESPVAVASRFAELLKLY